MAVVRDDADAAYLRIKKGETVEGIARDDVLRLPDGTIHRLGGEQKAGQPANIPGAGHLHLGEPVAEHGARGALVELAIGPHDRVRDLERRRLFEREDSLRLVLQTQV